jgi:hypothetical protein
MAECDDCHREAVVDVSGFPNALSVPDVALKLRCAQCGSKRIRVRLNIAEYYEALERAPLAIALPPRLDHHEGLKRPRLVRVLV